MRPFAQPTKCRDLVVAASHQGSTLLRLRDNVIRMADTGVAIVGLLAGMRGLSLRQNRREQNKNGAEQKFR